MWVSYLVIRGTISSFIEGAVCQNVLRFLLKAPCCTLGTGGALPTVRPQDNKVRPLGFRAGETGETGGTGPRDGINVYFLGVPGDPKKDPFDRR